MKKKIFVVFFLIINITFELFAQQIQRLTFTDMRSDGTIIGTVTVNAIFLAYSQHRISIENTFQVTHSSTYVNGVWSNWELVDRQPLQVPTLRLLYDIVLREYNKNPRSSVRLHYQDGIQLVRIATIPNGNSSPMWWSEDGRSINIFYENWMIIP